MWICHVSSHGSLLFLHHFCAIEIVPKETLPIVRLSFNVRNMVGLHTA